MRKTKFWKNFDKNQDKFFHEFIVDEIRDLLKCDFPLKFFWNIAEQQKQDYVVYNTEDLDLTYKYTKEYIDFLSSAKCVYEYSEKNLSFFQGTFTPYLPDLKSKYNNCHKEIEVLSYGVLLERRRDILENLKKSYDVHHVDNMTLKEMFELIKKSKWVLSVGSSTNIHNDLLRVTPALNMGANILLEETQEIWYNEYLKKNFSERIKYI